MLSRRFRAATKLFALALGSALGLAVILWPAARLAAGPAVPPGAYSWPGAADPLAVAKSYDVIVVGTDPEGIAAAVSAARNGLRTLLVDGRGRQAIGGLFTLGWLNSLDMNYTPEARVAQAKGVPSSSPDAGAATSSADPALDFLNGGIFREWFEKVGGTSFDVTKAQQAFNDLVRAEPNLTVALGFESFEPVIGASGSAGVFDSRAAAAPTPGTRTLRGLVLVRPDGARQVVSARAVIDATQDADIAVACGVPYTVGREDLGDKAGTMPVTLVFRLRNVTDEVWRGIQESIRAQSAGQGLYSADLSSAWGYVELAGYPATNAGRVAMRGLNIGRQADGTALVNALHIFGVDPLDPASRAEAMRVGRDEITHVVAYLKEHYPEFAPVELDGVALELYVRETRHIVGEYRLSILDVLENRDQWDRVAFGSYSVDIQRRYPSDAGVVLCQPSQYAVPFRSLVPLGVDGLLVVGRSASFDSLAAGSARVVPLGMATGQAAGAAAAVAAREGLTFRELSRSRGLIAELQERLNRQGMELRPFTITPADFSRHEAYAGLKVAVSLGAASGGYDNDFRLDNPSNPQRVVNNMAALVRAYPQAFWNNPAPAVRGLDSETRLGPVTLEQAARTILLARGIGASGDTAAATAERMGVLRAGTLSLIDDPSHLTNGDVFLLLRDALGKFAGVSYDGR